MIELIQVNLINTGLAVLLLAIAWLSNFSFSLYYNLRIVKENFSKEKFLNGLCKMLAIGFGLFCLVVLCTTIPAYFTYVGLELPITFIESFNMLIILGMFGTVTISYIKEAVITLKDILGADREEIVEQEEEETPIQ